MSSYPNLRPFLTADGEKCLEKWSQWVCYIHIVYYIQELNLRHVLFLRVIPVAS